MNYILVIDHIATGGAERILIDYYHHLQSMHHNVTIFCLSGNVKQSAWVEELNVVYGAEKDENNLIRKTFQQIRLFFKLKNLVKQNKADVVFSFLEKSNLLTILLPTKTRKVLTVHNVLSIQYMKIKSEIVRKMVYGMIRSAYNKCKNVIAVSEQVKSDLITSFNVISDNIQVVNNYVNKRDIKLKSQMLVEDYKFEDQIRHIVNIGRFSSQKSQWKLIKAYFIALRKGLVDTKLILMGRGEYEEDLKELTHNLNLDDYVSFLPFDTNPYKYMSKAHLFVLSSIYEGFPIVLAEASSLRIPFVGSQKSIPREFFESQEVWEESIFTSQEIEPDFSTTLHDEEYELADLLMKGINDEDFRERILKNTLKWEANNDVLKQFEMYDVIESDCIHVDSVAKLA